MRATPYENGDIVVMINDYDQASGAVMQCRVCLGAVDFRLSVVRESDVRRVAEGHRCETAAWGAVPVNALIYGVRVAARTSR